jgi:hypothetical protein
MRLRPQNVGPRASSATLGLYVMPQWRCRNLDALDPDRWLATRWELFQAPGDVHRDRWPVFRIFKAGDFRLQEHYVLHAFPVSPQVDE